MRISQLLILSSNGTPARQTFWELNRRNFHHLLYLHLFSIHSNLQVALFSFILHLCSCFLYSCPFNLIACLSSILMIQGLASIIQCLWNAYWTVYHLHLNVFCTRELLYFIPPVPSSTSACIIHINMRVLVAQALRKDQGHAFFSENQIRFLSLTAAEQPFADPHSSPHVQTDR